MRNTDASPDARRDAERYNRLVRALRHATRELRAMEDNGQPNLDEVLTRLLPDINAALNTERAFVAKRHSRKTTEDDQLDLIAVYPPQDLPQQPLFASDLLHQLIQDGQVRVIDPLGDEPQLILGLEFFQATSAILMRMQTIDQTYVVGVCNKRDAQTGPFLAADRITLNNILDLLAVGARANERLQHESESIQQISESVASGRLPEVAAKIVEQVVKLTKAVYAELWAVDKYHSQLTFVTATHALLPAWQPPQLTLPLNHASINGSVALKGDSSYLSDVRQEGNPPLWDDKMRAVFCVPLIWQGQVLGTLYVAGYAEEGISPDDRRFIKQLALHAAIALHNARVHDMRRRVIEFQQTVSDVSPLNEQMIQIREQLATQVDTGGFFIALYPGGTQQITFPTVFERGRPIPDVEKTPGSNYGPRHDGQQHGLVEWVITHRQTLLVDNFATWPRQAEIDEAGRAGVQCCLVVPLFRKGQIVGAIGLRGYDTAGSFDDYDRRFLEGLANHVATIIDNSQRFDAQVQELEQRVRELQAVSKFQERISNVDKTEAAELANIYQEAHNALRSIGLDTAHLYIALYRQESNTVEFPVVFEHGEQLTAVQKQARDAYRTRPLAARSDLTAWILRNHEPLLVKQRDDLEQWRRDKGEIQSIPEFSHSWLGAPMIASTELIGMIALRNFERDHIFDENHRNLLSIVASQAAIAIQNARLYQASREQIRRQQALYQAGKTIAAAGLALDAVLQAILEEAVAVTDAFFGTLQLVKGDHLEFVAAWPITEREALQRAYGFMPIHSSGITARAVRENRAQLVRNVAEDPDFVDGAKGRTGAELAVVLRQGGQENGRIVGVLNVEHRAVGGLDEEDQWSLIALSHLAVVAIQNAAQYTELESTKDRAIANEAVAWMGLFGADWQHTIHQHTTGMQTYIEGIRDLLEHPRLPEETAQRIQKGLDGLTTIVNRIRSTQFVGSIPEETPDQAEGETEIDETLTRYVGRWCSTRTDIQQQFDLRCRDVSVKILPQWLNVALEKLINNAIKAMPGGGVLRITTQTVGNMVHVTIADTGHGIPEFAREDFLRKVIRRPNGTFDRGTGKGALIARFIVQSYGGDLTLVDTQIGKGTTLLMKLRVVG